MAGPWCPKRDREGFGGLTCLLGGASGDGGREKGVQGGKQGLGGLEVLWGISPITLEALTMMGQLGGGGKGVQGGG